RRGALVHAWTGDRKQHDLGSSDAAQLELVADLVPLARNLAGIWGDRLHLRPHRRVHRHELANGPDRGMAIRTVWTVGGVRLEPQSFGCTAELGARQPAAGESVGVAAARRRSRPRAQSMIGRSKKR